jgi:hypothetical protein
MGALTANPWLRIGLTCADLVFVAQHQVIATRSHFVRRDTVSIARVDAHDVVVFGAQFAGCNSDSPALIWYRSVYAAFTFTNRARNLEARSCSFERACTRMEDNQWLRSSTS